MITSRQNTRIKEIRKLNAGAKFRKEAGVFAAEGIRLLEEGARSSFLPAWVIYTENLDQRGRELLEQYQKKQIPCDPVTPEVMRVASDTENPQGVLGVFPLQSLPLPSSPKLLVILDSLRDPGNLGTLMRTSLAAGAEGLLLTPGSVDPFSPKVVRSAMGAHFKLPFAIRTWPEISEITRGIPLLLADMEIGDSLWETDLTGPLGIVLGSEAHGPSAEARQRVERTIHIPMHEGIESLNAAVAGSIFLFETSRQRREIHK